MTPEQLAKSHTEEAEQRALFAYCAVAARVGFMKADAWAVTGKLDESGFLADVIALPELQLLFHIPNGGARGDDARGKMIRGNAMKAAGVKPGVSDLFLPVARGGKHGLFIEMKKPALKRIDKPVAGASQDQLEFADNVQAQGFAFALCYTWEEAVAKLKHYLSR